MQAPHRPTRFKKARVYKQPVMFIYFLVVPAALAFFPRLHVVRAFFFSGFFFVEMVLIKLYTLAYLWLRYRPSEREGKCQGFRQKVFYH